MNLTYTQKISNEFTAFCWQAICHVSGDEVRVINQLELVPARYSNLTSDLKLPPLQLGVADIIYMLPEAE